MVPSIQPPSCYFYLLYGVNANYSFVCTQIKKFLSYCSSLPSFHAPPTLSHKFSWSSCRVLLTLPLMPPSSVGIFVKGIGCAGNRTAALLITKRRTRCVTTTPNARVTRRWKYFNMLKYLNCSSLVTVAV